MKLSYLYESNNQIIVYKWMAGKNWQVHTRKGNLKENDIIIPKWVAGRFDSIGIFAGLVFNNANPKDEIYLVTINVQYNPTAVITQEFETFEYDDVAIHQIGELAFQGQPDDEELLIMYPGQIMSLYLAIPDESWNSITLYDKKGKKSIISL